MDSDRSVFKNVKMMWIVVIILIVIISFLIGFFVFRKCGDTVGKAEKAYNEAVKKANAQRVKVRELIREVDTHKVGVRDKIGVIKEIRDRLRAKVSTDDITDEESVCDKNVGAYILPNQDDDHLVLTKESHNLYNIRKRLLTKKANLLAEWAKLNVLDRSVNETHKKWYQEHHKSVFNETFKPAEHGLE